MARNFGESNDHYSFSQYLLHSYFRCCLCTVLQRGPFFILLFLYQQDTTVTYYLTVVSLVYREGMRGALSVVVDKPQTQVGTMSLSLRGVALLRFLPHS